MKNVCCLLLFSLGIVFTAQARPSEEDREKFHQAMKECIQETGVQKPSREQRPSEADRAKIDACLESKGIAKPPKMERKKD